jgi:hypothetical protein
MSAVLLVRMLCSLQPSWRVLLGRHRSPNFQGTFDVALVLLLSDATANQCAYAVRNTVNLSPTDEAKPVTHKFARQTVVELLLPSPALQAIPEVAEVGDVCHSRACLKSCIMC